MGCEFGIFCVYFPMCTRCYWGVFGLLNVSFFYPTARTPFCRAQWLERTLAPRLSARTSLRASRQSPMPHRASTSAVLLASVGACLRHLPPSLHSASVTPAPILFTICTQKPRQPQTMYLICTHVVCTRAIYQTYKKCKDLWWCRCALCRSAVENYHTIPHPSILSPSLFSLLFPLRGFQTNDYIIRQRICSL